MKNIHVLTTDKPSRLHLIEDTLAITSEYKNSVCDAEVNIYITSDVDITDVRQHKGKWQLEKEQILNKFPNYLTDLSECKLVILTTDQDLINDGVQPIDDEFLEWFVNNSSCEMVEVKPLLSNNGRALFGYKIIIPKEEPKQFSMEADLYENHCIVLPELSKPETLEEAVNNFKKTDVYINEIKQTQERMYSEEEVLQLLLRLQQTESYDNLYDWFEEFKKK